MTRTNVKTANSELIDQPMIWSMVNATPQKVGAMKKRIADLIEQREALSIEHGHNQHLSNDWSKLTDWIDNDSLARLFIACEIDPKGYILNRYLDDAELIKRGFDPEARTHALKPLEKVRQVAEYIVSGNSKLQPVFKTFLACAIVASAKGEKEIYSTAYVRFLSNIRLDDISADLADSIEKYQAKHFGNGAPTQSSQMNVTIPSLRIGRRVKQGKMSGFQLDPNSPILQALAERFGMQEHLQAIAS